MRILEMSKVVCLCLCLVHSRGIGSSTPPRCSSFYCLFVENQNNSLCICLAYFDCGHFSCCSNNPSILLLFFLVSFSMLSLLGLYSVLVVYTIFGLFFQLILLLISKQSCYLVVIYYMFQNVAV